MPFKVTLLFGPIVAPFEILSKASANFERHWTTCCSKKMEDTEMEPMQKFNETTMQIVRAKGLWQRKQQVPLITLLRLFRKRNATDNRDKVYALLSLVTEWGGRAPIGPDYSIKAGKLHEAVVSNILGIAPFLSTLSLVSDRMAHKIGSQLSFARKPIFKRPPLALEHPLWSQDSDEINPHDERVLQKLQLALLYNSAPCKSQDPVSTAWASCTYIARTKVLRLRAIHVGRVSKDGLVHIRLNGEPNLKPALLNLPTNKDKIDNKPYVGGGSDYEARWRTLCADAINEPTLESAATSTFRRARSEDVEAFEAWRDWILQTPKNRAGSDGNSQTDVLINRFNTMTRLALSGKSLARTTNGYIGLVPRYSVPGDDIFVVVGARQPVLLHSVGELDVEGVGKMHGCMYMGECYIHGVMDGQWLQNAGDDEMEICLI